MSKKGLTMIELVIAISLSLFLMVAVGQSINLMIKTNNKIYNRFKTQSYCNEIFLFIEYKINSSSSIEIKSNKILMYDKNSILIETIEKSEDKLMLIYNNNLNNRNNIGKNITNFQIEKAAGTCFISMSIKQDIFKKSFRLELKN